MKTTILHSFLFYIMIFSNLQAQTIFLKAKVTTGEYGTLNMNFSLEKKENLAGLFVVWDEPAILAAKVLEQLRFSIPMTTIDLGNAAAINMAKGGVIKGIGAQRPYDQGKAAATAALLALLGRQLPSWVALPGHAVTQDNVVEAYQMVWHTPAPPELIKVRRR